MDWSARNQFVMNAEPPSDLRVAEVRARIEGRLTGAGLSHLKVAAAQTVDEDTIVAVIVDPNETVVLSVEVDRYTGALQRIY